MIATALRGVKADNYLLLIEFKEKILLKIPAVYARKLYDIALMC